MGSKGAGAEAASALGDDDAAALEDDAAAAACVCASIRFLAASVNIESIPDGLPPLCCVAEASAWGEAAGPERRGREGTDSGAPPTRK